MQIQTMNMKNITIFLTSIFILFGWLPMFSQRHEIMQDNIASLQVISNDNWMELPIVTLGSSDKVNISFDDLTHTYQRYAYRIEHCESDWSTSSELFESDYVNGFASGNIIEDIEESINTNVLYTHYSFSIPNRNCDIKLSGNYKVTIYDDNDDERTIATVCFMVLEPRVGVELSVSSNTDVDINNSHQQISMQISYGNLRVTNHQEQIKTIVLQNQQWHDARVNAKPQYVTLNGLRWEHCYDYIFNAGNEYYKFEVLDPTHPTMGIERIFWDGNNYQAVLFEDTPALNYLYDEDANGSFYIRNSDNFENNRTSEYVVVNFTLRTPQRYIGYIYVNGTWTYDSFKPEYRMKYNAEAQCYQAAILLKQGYYSYKYLLVDNNNNITNLPNSGNFFQTENSYQALVYYREQGGRTDRLVGYAEVFSR